MLDIKVSLRSLPLLTFGMTIGLSAFTVHPVQAASFGFDYIYLGSGELSFGSSSLTGVGRETATLAELASFGPVNFNYIYRVPPSDSYYADFTEVRGNGGDAEFTFLDGNLIGITLEDAGGYSYGFSEFSDFNNYVCQYLGSCLETFVDVSVSFYGSSVGSTKRYHNERYQYGTLVEVGDYTVLDVGAEINFITYEPIATAVPEPLTILGVGTAMSFGALFKKKTTKNSKR